MGNKLSDVGEEPKPVTFAEFRVDDKVIGILRDCAATSKEKKRLQELYGIEIRPASNESIRKFLPHFA